MVDLLIIILFINYDNKKRKWIEILFASDFAYMPFYFYFCINWSTISFPIFREYLKIIYDKRQKRKKMVWIWHIRNTHNCLPSLSFFLFFFFRREMWKDLNVAPMNSRSASLTRMEASSLYHLNLNTRCRMVEARTKFWKFQLLLH